MANERVHKIIRIKIIYMQNEIDVFLTVPLYVGLLLFSIWYNIYIFVMTEKKFAFFSVHAWLYMAMHMPQHLNCRLCI